MQTIAVCKGLHSNEQWAVEMAIFAGLMEKNWQVYSGADPEETGRLAAALGVAPLVARLLLQRGIDTAEAAYRFFHPDLRNLHDPFLMADMDVAVSRLEAARARGEKVLIYGDYDVDGTTAVALVHSFLSAQGFFTSYYIPDRHREGYGFSAAGVAFAREGGFSLIITLDCGIKDRDRVLLATEAGIDVIICDHHNAGELPPALAVLNPKRPDCPYPYKGLSGCGVGFKLMQAYSQRAGIEPGRLFAFLDLVTISIGADIVPLTGENRILARFGLALLQTQRRPGIAALLEQADFKKSALTISDVVFLLAPRINAAGRIFSGTQAVALLVSDSGEDARPIARAIEENNKTRKALDSAITGGARQLIAADPFYTDSFATVVYQPDWHKGVVGIVAARLVEQFYKPTVVLTENEGKLTGSARSIAGIDLYETLSKCAPLLEQFGGHTMAAGLSLKPANFEAFREAFDRVVGETLGYRRPTPQLPIDAELSFDALDHNLFQQLEWFQPFGPENMTPLFLTRGLVDAGGTRTVGNDGKHLKLQLRRADGSRAIDGIAFDMGHLAGMLKEGRAADVVYSLEENEWNGRVSLQLMVRDIRLSANQASVTPAS